ncbi:ROK family protein [Streptococcus sp. DD13]|uniref:ROK family protein n=1 Tax=Streptococcus sp. DD13 TaxID=1777881 RepID=UPI00079B76CF|nr:ROK family protein [Streptococcus sp. DD13]KXT78956.1 N-acetylmannosamine kinase [Streptococcus sp. DD13]
MVIATVDIGGTGVKFASMTRNGKVLSRQAIPTPACLEDLLTWLDLLLTSQDYEGLSISVPGSVDPHTGVIGGISAVPYIHGFSWYEKLAQYSFPIHLENDANCVGLSELLAQPDLDNAACVVVGTGIGGALILNGRLHRGRHGLGGEFGYMLLSEPGESLGNWSLLASTGSLVRAVRARKHSEDWNGKKIYQAAADGDVICQEAIDHMNRQLAKGILNIQYLFDPDQICIGGSISQNPAFITGVQEAVSSYVDRYDEFTVAPRIQACTYQADANLYGALVNWLQEENEWPHLSA